MKSLAVFICIMLAIHAPARAQEPTIKSVWDAALGGLDTFVADGTMSISVKNLDHDAGDTTKEVDFHWEKDGLNFFVELRRTKASEIGRNQLDEIIPYRSIVVGNSETVSGFDFIRKHPRGGTGFISPRSRNTYPNQNLLVAFEVNSGVAMFFPPKMTEWIGSTKISSITREPIRVVQPDEEILVFIDPNNHMLVRTDSYKTSADGKTKTTTGQSFFPDGRRPKSLGYNLFKESYITTCRLEFSKFELIKPERIFELTESEKILGADIVDESRVRPSPK